MRDGVDRAPAAPLARPGRLRPSWRRRLARAVVLGLAIAVVAQRSALFDRAPDCAAAMDRAVWTSAVQICARELERTQDPHIAIKLADAQDRAGDTAAAKRTASQWLTGAARADALQLLGGIAHREGRHGDAVTALELARELHRIEHQPGGLARDAALLALVHLARDDYAEALREVDACVTQASLAGLHLLVLCHLTAAQTLIAAGYSPAAEHELALARLFPVSASQRGDLAYQEANLEQEAGSHEKAGARFEEALELRGTAATRTWRITTELNLAYSLAETGDLAGAERHWVDATVADPDHDHDLDRWWTGAQIAYRQHDLARAATFTDAYVARAAQPEEQPINEEAWIDVATLRARIELARGDLASADRWAHQGVDEAERVRDVQPLELRPWVLAKRRAPYEVRFTALARAGQVEDAMMVFDQWQGRTVEDALATPRPPSLDYRQTADQLTRLGAWLRTASPAAIAREANRDAVLGALRGIDLLALIVAEGEVWRLTARHGPPRLERLGAVAEIDEQLSEFRTSPTADPRLASELGAWLIPDDAFRTTRDALYIILDGKLDNLPIAGLRRAGQPLGALRPLAWLLRLPEARCIAVSPPGRATVIGYAAASPTGQPTDLARPPIPAAELEADQVAELLGTTSATGSRATSAALFAASGDAVLHVATHAGIRADDTANDAALTLDRELPAFEILAHRVGPALAVLSVCNAARAADDERAGSLAAAFLGAGSRHVVATMGSVSDEPAREVATRFYRAGGVADPARALAAVQRELAATGNPDWPRFAAFGLDVCAGGDATHH